MYIQILFTIYLAEIKHLMKKSYYLVCVEIKSSNSLGWIKKRFIKSW